MPNAKYLELLPPEALKPLIKCFWISANDSGADLYFTTLPDGCLELVVFYQGHVFKNVMLFGLQSEAYDLVMPNREMKIGIRFKPLAKEYYLDNCQTLDRFATFSTALPGELSDALQHFAAQVTADLYKVAPLTSMDHRKLRLFDLLQQTSGNIDVETLATRCSWSSRQMNRYLNKQLGMSLKSYSSILRCHASYREIKSGHLHPDLGYFDQSHFIREIKKYTGATPKILLKNDAHRFLQLNDPADNTTD